MFEPGINVRHARLLAVVWLLWGCGVALAQTVEAGAAEATDDGCRQTVLYPFAGSRTGAVALLASVDGALQTHVRMTIGLRYERPLFGLENFVKVQMPNAVAFVVGAEEGRVHLGPPSAMLNVTISDLGYLPNTGTEFITVDVPLEVFQSWLHPPRAVSGRVDTRRYYVEFLFPAAFFEALADGFAIVCLGTEAPAAEVPLSAAPMPEPHVATAPRGAHSKVPPLSSADEVPVAMLEQRAITFVAQSIQDWSLPNDEALPLVAQHYAARVEFYGNVWSRERVLQDKQTLAARWPVRDYALDVSTATATCTQTVCTVAGEVMWEARSPERDAVSRGRSVIELTLLVQPAGFVITREDGHVIQRL